MGLFDKLKSASVALGSDIVQTVKEKSETITQTVEQTSKGIAERTQQLVNEASKASRELSDSLSDAAKEMSKEVADAKIMEWAKTMPETLRSYADRFDADELWEKLKITAAKAGQELLIMVLAIYYAIENSIQKLKESRK